MRAARFTSSLMAETAQAEARGELHAFLKETIVLLGGFFLFGWFFWHGNLAVPSLWAKPSLSFTLPAKHDNEVVPFI